MKIENLVQLFKNKLLTMKHTIELMVSFDKKYAASFKLYNTMNFNTLKATMASKIIAQHYGISYYWKHDWNLVYKAKQIKDHESPNSLNIKSGSMITITYSGTEAYHITQEPIPPQGDHIYGRFLGPNGWRHSSRQYKQ